MVFFIELKIKNFNEIIFIENGIDTFYVKICKNNYKLYHKNKKHNKQCYHLQSKKFYSLNDILKYCKNHKKRYFKNKKFENINKIEVLLKNEKEQRNGRRIKIKTTN